MSASGLDLARVALAAAKAAARKNGAGGAAKRPAKRSGAGRPRGMGRDPVSLGDALAAVSQDRGWQDGTRVGSLLDRWTQLVPDDMARAAVPERFDQERRILHLRPVSQAAASMLRWKARELAAQINTSLGAQAVAAVNVLSVKSNPSGWSSPVRDAPAGASAAKTSGYVPGLRVGCGAPMPQELKAWLAGRRAEREQRPVDEARAQLADRVQHRGEAHRAFGPDV
ncbi:DciA family protein [Kitasatospora sp. NPDC004272]